MSSAQQSPLDPEQIAGDARWLVQALDPNQGNARLVAMDRETYREASFLDDRLMQRPVDAQIVPWHDIEGAIGSNNMRTDARWIFHIGHVGSTLLSRLLGEVDGVLAIREPRSLRDLALSPPAVRGRYLAAMPKLMSRTFGEHEVACVKATSFASEIAAELVPAGERALFMYATPRNYVASILAGENSVKELHALADYRGQRLAARGVVLPAARNDAERAAAAWACEMATLEAAAGAMADRSVEWADFDKMLSDMAGELLGVASFFGFPAQTGQVAAIAGGPLMKRYSKDPSYDYSPNLRHQLIDQEIGLQGREIEAALALLRSAAEKSDLLTRALTRAEGN
jgi:hypothetical protein